MHMGDMFKLVKATRIPIMNTSIMLQVFTVCRKRRTGIAPSVNRLKRRGNKR